jgi:DNA adenine methylase
MCGCRLGRATAPSHRQRIRGQVTNVASVPHRSPFRYPGGKTWLAPHVRRWLRSLPHKPREFIEPFAGGAIIGLSVAFEDLADKVTLVELDGGVAAVWKTILSDDAPGLVARIESFEVTRDSVRAVLDTPPRSTLDEAFATILRNRMQRGGILAPGASLMKEGENGRGLLSRWYPQTLNRRILAIHHLRNRITFIHGDGMEFIGRYARRKNSVWFLDPPYTVAGRRLYLHSEIDHAGLFRLAARLVGDFLMTYDNAEPIRLLARKHRFQTRLVPMKSTHHAVMEELLIGRHLAWV